MKQRLSVRRAEIKGEELHLFIDENIDLSKIKASGQMLVDSDQLAFVYLVEFESEYSYVVIPVEHWALIKEALHSTIEVYVVNKQGRIRLRQLKEEMTYLIENIKGNSNYGEEMVHQVERIF
ncbi:hypothetical protein [Bacillus sp. B15-48]|uniref:UPF0738 family protein n=1 Tax=Bacillus sp. B15-48 TaxID=1548601 RepID=UPI00193FC67A|nr:hypothetical protein [Bacillus sp. B15-48]MBM4764256.1 hypothetical protein [Bacillus sp. B15-48]